MSSDDDTQEIRSRSTLRARSSKSDAEYPNASNSNDAALQSLEELFSDGIIDGSRMAKLKLAYERLQSHLRKTRRKESELLQEAKDFSNKLQTQLTTIGNSEEFPNNDDSDANRFRIELLNHSNELLAAEDRLYELNYKAEGLREEKLILERELKSVPVKEEVEKRIKDLQKCVDEIKIEIVQKSQEKKNLIEEIDVRKSQLGAIESEIEQLDVSEADLKSSLVNVMNEPSHISKQADLLRKQERELEKRKDNIVSRIEELSEEIKELSRRKKDKEEDYNEISEMLFAQKTVNESKEREADLLHKEGSLAKEKQAEMLGDRTNLDLKLKHAVLEKKSEHENHLRKLREKDRNMKTLKKAELQLKVATDNCDHVNGIYMKLKQIADCLPKDDGSLLDKRKELLREVDSAKRSLAQQNALTSHERQRVDFGIQEEERLLAVQGQLRVDVGDLTRLAQIKADEREQKARDYLKAELRLQRVNEDLRTKDLSIQDNAKRLTEVQHRLSDFAKLYDIIKNERNKCVNLIQSSSQKAAEMREKIKILQNEIEILRTSSASKERLLQKAKLKHSNAIVARDGIRNEASKQHLIADDLAEKRDQQHMSIAQLLDTINKAEEKTINLRRRYETALNERNSRGITLIERNEEVCIFYERVNVQDAVIRNGDLEMQSREEEIRFLKMELADLKRAVDLLRKNVPNKRALDNDYVTLQIQLSQCQDYMTDLERSLETPSNKERIRLLGGKDPNGKDLLKKFKTLEGRLANKEAQSLEKDLILEDVTRLMNQTSSNVQQEKSVTLDAATKINELQAKINDVTRKMMATVSELSMHQATALKLQQEAQEKEAILKQCYIRMERGEPPSDEIEHEWLKTLRDEVNRRNAKLQQMKREEEADCYKIPGGIMTTAEPRPNAYIPNNEVDLPIPRPYGSNAPFKPTEPGSNMRHFRKPVLKPIEI